MQSYKGNTNRQCWKIFTLNLSLEERDSTFRSFMTMIYTTYLTTRDS